MTETEIIADIHAQLRNIATKQGEIAEGLSALTVNNHAPGICALTPKVEKLQSQSHFQKGVIAVISIIGGFLGSIAMFIITKIMLR